MRKTLVTLLLAALWSQGVYGKTVWCDPSPVTFDSAKKRANIEVQWNTAKSCTYDNSSGRIDERMSVAVTVTHFNYLHYGLKFDIEEETIEAYAELADFWAKFFGLDISTAFEDAKVRKAKQRLPCTLATLTGKDGKVNLRKCLGGNFDVTTFRWRKLLREGQEQLANNLKKHTKVQLTSDQVDEISKLREEHLKAVEVLEVFKAKAFGQARSNAELNLYDKVEPVHKQVLDAYQQFEARAELVANGQKHTIKKKKPGTVVSVNMSAARLDGSIVTEPTKKLKTAVSVEYFVHSRYPLLFHVGPTYTDGIDESEFKTVRKLAEEDLFAKVTGDTEDLDLTAFLSWQFLDFGGKRDLGLMVTFGTAFDKPGEKLYGGLSLRWKRWILTGGWSRAEVVEGEGMVMNEEATDPDLFRVLRKGSDEGTFWSISFNVFGIK